MHQDQAPQRPVVLITGVAGDIGRRLAHAFSSRYRVVGLDRPGKEAPCELLPIDLTDDESVARALDTVRERYGTRIASVIHLAAYFDFTGEEHPLYRAVNVEGTRRLLAALERFDVEQFLYPGTMLVHAPAAPGERIDESAPVSPKWAYPRSKAEAEEVIRAHRADMPRALLHFAGVYDESTCVPTLGQQIARVYERDLMSHLYAGRTDVGQSFLHLDDLVDAVERTVERRAALPPEVTILIGEPDAPSFETLQDDLGRLIHGAEEWATLSVPRWAAKAGAQLQVAAEPLVPDAIDRGEPPFIRPFMIDLSEDHYALDITRARELLGWQPRHSIRDTLPKIVQALKADPLGWYRNNGITPPEWLEAAAQADRNPEVLRRRHERSYRETHQRNLWAPFCNLALGTWLLTSPATLGYSATPLAWSDIASGIALLVLAALSLSWRMAWARWGCATLGLWLLFAPLVFWTPSAAAYLNGTLAGMLAIGFAVLVPPAPGINPLAATHGPTVPPGWDFSPSSWMQRLPIIALAFVGLYVSRYLAAYQLGHIDAVWEPFFPGSAANPRNGTEEIITSSVSEAWPVSDAGVGALTYALEILTGMIGSARRWRTMPWLVVAFGIMIVPLGVVSITFIVIQPIIIGTWCSLCLIAAAAMLIQIPYSLDELVATGQFLARRKRAGQSVLRVFFVGDTDEPGDERRAADDFEQPPRALIKDMLTGGVSVPWNLGLCLAIGVWLMSSRLTVGAEGALANADHLIGSLVLTVTVIATAEIARIARYANVPLGVALLIVPFVWDAAPAAMISDVAAGLALIALSLRRGPVRCRYGSWARFVR